MCLVQITARESIYHHVDAAYAGSGWICHEVVWLVAFSWFTFVQRALVCDGFQNVNSLALNPVLCFCCLIPDHRLL